MARPRAPRAGSSKLVVGGREQGFHLPGGESSSVTRGARSDCYLCHFYVAGIGGWFLVERRLYHSSGRTQSRNDSPCRFVIFGKASGGAALPAICHRASYLKHRRAFCGGSPALLKAPGLTPRVNPGPVSGRHRG